MTDKHRVETKSGVERCRELLRAVRLAPNVDGTETLVRFLEDVLEHLERHEDEA